MLGLENSVIVIDKLEKDIYDFFRNFLNKNESKFNKIVSGLDALSPMKTLLRGYSIIEKDNYVVKSINDLNIGDNIKIILSDGEKNANII